MSEDPTRTTIDPGDPTGPTRPPGTASSPDTLLGPGTTLAHYTIVRLLGIGGMGAVYVATQEKPNRQVALKLIRPGYASHRLLKRFEIEAEILGRLNHPNIARVYEAGIADTPAGRHPFFAMELVVGSPLDAYARAHNLATHERLALFARICDAVHHAHACGVIHRDLKPGNILVTTDGHPKILDFGVARLTDADVKTITIQTDIGQLIGTVPYMSPEQAGGNPDDLDTRSDVYALGVVLYELLVGRLPYDLDRKLIHEAVRIIREDDPTPLSSINKTLRGDVDTIVATALAKEKARRYPSAEAMASDIRRYLKHEPIAARPASTWYQLTKFARRNRALVAGIAAAFLILLAGIAATSWQAVAATRARDEARANLARAEQAEAAAKARAEELEKVAAFQSSQLSGIDTALMGSRLRQSILDATPEPQRAALDLALTEVNFTDIALGSLDQNIFDRALKAIESEFHDQPLIKARLLHTIANTLTLLGLLDEALDPQVEALDIRRRILGEVHPDSLSSTNDLGYLLQEQGKLPEAEMCFRRALDAMRSNLGEDHPDTLVAMNNLGLVLNEQGKAPEAEQVYRDALARFRRVLGENHPDTLTSINNLALLLRSRGQLSEAEPLYREALEKCRVVLGEYHPDTLTSIANLGVLLQSQGKLSEAEPLLQESLEKRRQVLGDEHPDTLLSVNNFGGLLWAKGQLADAEPYFREAVEKRRRVLGEDHQNTLVSVTNLGGLLRAQSKHQEAIDLLAPIEPVGRRVFTGGNARRLANLLTTLGRARMGVHGDTQRFPVAEANLLEAHAIFVEVRGEAHEETLECAQALIDLYTSWHTAEPGKGYDTKTAQWQAKLDAISPSSEPAPTNP